MQKLQKLIGVFGGTFDPLHLGHLGAIDELSRELTFDAIHWVLSARPPHLDVSLHLGNCICLHASLLFFALVALSLFLTVSAFPYLDCPARDRFSCAL